jgi:hypothetical protein
MSAPNNRAIAIAWFAAFNAHDLKALLALYHDNAQHRPQAMGNLMYETNSRIFFQQAEQAVKATIQGNMLVLEVNAMMNMRADSYLAIFNLSHNLARVPKRPTADEQRIKWLHATLENRKA